MKWFFLLGLLMTSSCASVEHVIATSPELEPLRELGAHFQRQAEEKQFSKKIEQDVSAVIGGEEVLKEDPLRDSIVLLKISKGKDISVCTATLVSSQNLLTAAHCVNKVSAENLQAVFLNKLTDDTEAVSIKSVHIHPQYDGTTKSFSDMAVLTLKKAMTKKRSFISLAKNTELIHKDEITLAGYGITSEELKDSMSLRKIQKSFKNEIYLRGQIIGVGQRNESGGFCRGDSGAPIIAESKQGPIVIGVNSFTVELEKGKECRSASVAISVPNNWDWILSQMDNPST